MASPPKIRKLDEVVVNRIAAGEIIQRPANALKELIENSLDAKSTDIQITVKDGGLKLLQIQDNGTGIRKDDLDIVCERFTTSKLTKFEDLQTISTYGFRGEALASISHVAQLTITTKTAQEKVAYKASYIDGKLKSGPKPIAGNQGTLIAIENLFYNVATRRKALENSTEQFSYINDVVTRYAIHNSGVGFTLKKHGSHTPVLRTPFKATKINNIKVLFGIEISREIIEVSFEDTDYKFKCQALFTNPNYSNKKSVNLLFINHRLVESTPMKKMLDDLYSVYLPKRTFPWVYISLEINPHNIDVNVHPTKSEVRFIHEEKIIDRVKSALDEKLSSNNSARTFYIQARLPEVNVTKDILAEVLPEYDNNKSKDKQVYAKEMIRVDHREQKLDKFNFTVTARPEEGDQSIEKNETITNNQQINSEMMIADESLLQNVGKFGDQSTERSKTMNNNQKTNSEMMNVDEFPLQKDVEMDFNIVITDFQEKGASESSKEATENNVNVTNLNEANKFDAKDNDLPVNSEDFITSTQIERPAEGSRSQLESPLIPDSIAELFTTDESSNEFPTEPVPMSKPARRAMDTVLKLFGSQPSFQEQEDKTKENQQKNKLGQAKDQHEGAGKKDNNDEDGNDNENASTIEFKSYSINNFRRDVQITSVLQLRKVIEDTYHGGLKKILSELKFIASITEILALIQSDVHLYICDTKALAEELFYEIMLYDFANYGVLKFSEPLSIVELSLIGLDLDEAGWTEEERPKVEIANDVKNLLVSKADMLKEYFSMAITKNGYLKSVPMLLENYYPSEADLPLFILRLATEVNWDEEKPCFDGICRETARFFSHVNVNSQFYDWKHLIEHILYPTIKESLLPPNHFSHDSTILRIASLPDLYKVFERC